ncbi:LysR family transcriptional regulator [Kitasatospora kifunensis]|uniref:DNA-binding transcriptional LysR family regulator n=1 Tax=Kitasatospora kifunensis TaxID=58351 RepID=A0A7W7R6W2_KITKI|nr:LysR family transcriptional regulator [Kitasatospora kifunensis]MBB4926420.1 DNA-binding transcriptional LysR family regulator [Kitasatospora kifunensis]
MTLDDLRVFVAACESGNLSAVARDLSRTQSAISQHVRRLESELGLTLLERRPRGVAPTQAGQILHRAASQGLGHLDLALRQLRDLRNGERGTVRITTGATTMRHFMTAAVVHFRRQHPDVNLEFRTETSSRSCFDALAAGEADLAWITIGAAVRGIEQRPVIELPWVLAVHAEDPLAQRELIEPADLSRIRPIRLPENSVARAQLDGQLAHRDDADAEPNATTSVADWDTAILLAEIGLGHAVVPALPGWRAPDHPTLRLIPIPALPPLAVGWAVRQWGALTSLAQEFAETVATQAAAN